MQKLTFDELCALFPESSKVTIRESLDEAGVAGLVVVDYGTIDDIPHRSSIGYGPLCIFETLEAVQKAYGKNRTLSVYEQTPRPETPEERQARTLHIGRAVGETTAEHHNRKSGQQSLLPKAWCDPNIRAATVFYSLEDAERTGRLVYLPCPRCVQVLKQAMAEA